MEKSRPSGTPAIESRRIFFAVDMPGEMKAKVAELSNRLQKASLFTGANILWVPPENFHLTLYFLGQVDVRTISRLVSALETKLEAEPFDLDVRTIGFFPQEARVPPKVLWLGIHKAPDELKRLRENCAAAIRSAGIPVPEQDFSPHITLARFKSTRNLRAFRDLTQQYQFTKLGTCSIHQLTLMESQTGGGPARYAPVQQFPLLPSVQDVQIDDGPN